MWLHQVYKMHTFMHRQHTTLLQNENNAGQFRDLEYFSIVPLTCVNEASTTIHQQFLFLLFEGRLQKVRSQVTKQKKQKKNHISQTNENTHTHLSFSYYNGCFNCFPIMGVTVSILPSVSHIIMAVKYKGDPQGLRLLCQHCTGSSNICKDRRDKNITIRNTK